MDFFHNAEEEVNYFPDHQGDQQEPSPSNPFNPFNPFNPANPSNPFNLPETAPCGMWDAYAGECEQPEDNQDFGYDADNELAGGVDLDAAVSRCNKSTKRAMYYDNQKGTIREHWDTALPLLRYGRILTHAPLEVCIYCNAHADYRCFDCGGGDHPISMCEGCHATKHRESTMLALHRWELFTVPANASGGDKCWVTRPKPVKSIHLSDPLKCKCETQNCSRATKNMDLYTRHGPATHFNKSHATHTRTHTHAHAHAHKHNKVSYFQLR
jgi:hypothetical protein